MTEQQVGWRGRGTLAQLVSELNRQKETKVDFVSDSRNLSVITNGDIRLAPFASPQVEEWLGRHGTPFLPQALGQLGERLSPAVPQKFGRELFAAHPFIGAKLFTELLHSGNGRRLIRMLDGRVRAVLSDRYRIVDNYDMAFAALNVAQQHGGEVIECSLSDTNMRIKFTSRAVWDKIDEKQTAHAEKFGQLGSHEWLGKTGFSKGDLPGGPGTVHPLVTISNSETGNGGIGVRIGLLRAICVNLVPIEDVVMKVHLGERLEAGLFSQETIAAESQAIALKIRDSIAMAFNLDGFKRLVAKATQAQQDVIAAPAPAVANIVQAAGLNQAQEAAILQHFLRDSDLTRYGLSQAVARAAQDTDDGDVATDLENLAGRIISEPALVAA